MRLLMPDISCGKNLAEEYWWEALQSNLLPCNHSRVALPSVSQNVPKRVRQLVYKPVHHSVCTKGLQDNLLMGSRGWGLRILSSSIWENCWLLFNTHITIFFSSSGTHSKSLHRISHVCLSKSVYSAFRYTWRVTSLVPLDLSHLATAKRENENKAGQQPNEQVEQNTVIHEKKRNQFHIIKNIF